MSKLLRFLAGASIFIGCVATWSPGLRAPATLAATPTPSATASVAPTATGTAVAATPTLATVGQDPAAVLQQGINALNRGDVVGLLSLFASDAVFQGGGPLCAAAPCTGKAQIAPELQILAAGHLQFMLSNVRSSGDTATTDFTAKGDYTRAAGVQRIVGAMTVRVVGGSVVSFYAPLNQSDPETARYISYWVALLRGRASEASGAGGLPTTGLGAGGGRSHHLVWIAWAMLALGCTLFAVGLRSRAILARERVVAF